MRYLLPLLFLIFLSSCDHIENPYPAVSTDLDTTLYPGLWSDYVSNEWPSFTQNQNINRNILIEDFTGHTCMFCPLAADEAHNLYVANPGRVYVAAIHAGPNGLDDFQTVSPPDYPLDFTNPQGIELGAYFGSLGNGGFTGNPRGSISRKEDGGNIFQSPSLWSNLTNAMLNENDLKVNIQGQINYYDATKGAYVHVEVEKVDAGLNNDLGIVSYLIEDSLVGDQKMPDNSHNSSYVHRDTHRGNLSGSAFGRNLTSSLMSNNKYYVDYSFVVPNQLDGNHNPSNMHVLVYVYDLSTLEVYQVIKLPFQ